MSKINELIDFSKEELKALADELQQNGILSDESAKRLLEVDMVIRQLKKMQILYLLSSGKSGKEVSDIMGVSPAYVSQCKKQEKAVKSIPVFPATEPTANPFKTYSCRFEFNHDYTTFVVAADKRGILIATSELYHVRETVDGPAFPDIHVEFFSKADLETLRDVLRGCTDLHVGLQSLRQVPLKDNSLERDYDLI